MQLQYTASFRYRMRDYYRRVLRELQSKKGVVWREEPQYIGCSSLESVFTIKCRKDQQEEIERRLLLRLPVYQLEQWGENHPEGFIDIAPMLQGENKAVLWARRG